MRSINKTLHGLLDRGMHEEQNEVLVMKSFMVLQKVYVLCFAEGLCFYVLLKAHVSTFC